MPNSQLTNVPFAQNAGNQPYSPVNAPNSAFVPATTPQLIANKGDFDNPADLTEDLKSAGKWVKKFFSSTANTEITAPAPVAEKRVAAPDDIQTLTMVITPETKLDGSKDTTWEFRNFFKAGATANNGYNCTPQISLIGYKNGILAAYKAPLPWLTCDDGTKAGDPMPSDKLFLHYRVPGEGDVSHWYNGLQEQGFTNIQKIFFNSVDLAVADRNDPTRKQESPTFTLEQYVRHKDGNVYPIGHSPIAGLPWTLIGIVAATTAAAVVSLEACVYGTVKGIQEGLRRYFNWQYHRDPLVQRGDLELAEAEEGLLPSRQREGAGQHTARETLRRSNSKDEDLLEAGAREREKMTHRLDKEELRHKTLMRGSGAGASL